MDKRQHHHFDQVEKLDPITGYPERDIIWFRKHIFADMAILADRHRLYDETLLDIGCAKGYFTKEYTKLFNRVVGIDFSGNRIKEANEFNSEVNLEFREMDITKDTFAVGGQFTVAIESAVFQHIDPAYRSVAFSNIRRSMKTGGLLFLYDHFQETAGPEHQFVATAPWNGFIEELKISDIRKLSGFRLCEPVIHDISISGGGFYIYRMILQAV